MATVTPIDVERYLLEGEAGEEDLLSAAGLKRKPGAPPTKPPLEDALLNAYNKAGGTTLKPGELPPPIEPPPPEPGVLQKAGTAISSAVGTAARIPGQIYESLPSITAPRGPDVTTTIPPSTTANQQAPTTTAPIATGTQPPATGTVAAPAPQRQYESGIYGTLQRHANFVRDIAEAGGQTLAGMGAFAFGAATAASDILNAQLARVARGGPLAGGPESSTHYRDIFTRMDKTISDLTPEPRSDIAKNVNKAIGTVTGLVKDVAELPAKGLTAIGVLNEDTAKVLSFATELYLFYKLDRGIREAAPELRAKIADFKTRMSKATSDAEVAGVASDLADAAAKNPKLNDALDEARGKFRGEADREAGRPPRGPNEPPGGAPGGEAIHPDDLRVYSESLQQRAAELRNEGASFSTIETELGKVPKPQPRDALAEVVRLNSVLEGADPIAQYNAWQELRGKMQPGETLENSLRRTGASEQVVANVMRVDRELQAKQNAGLAPEDIPMDTERVAADFNRAQQERAQPQAAPAPEAQRAAPTMERQVQSEVVVGQDTSIARPAPEAPVPPTEPVRPATQAPTPPTGAQGPIDFPGAFRGATQEAFNQYKRMLYDTYTKGGTRSPGGGQELSLIVGATLKAQGVEIPRNRFITSVEELARINSEVRDAGGGGPELTARVNEYMTRLRDELRPTPQAAATVAPETVPAPVSSEPTVAAVPPSSARTLLNEGKLAELKRLAREAAGSSHLTKGLLDLGFPREEVRAIAEQLRTIRAAKAGTETLQQVASKPAVQTAATEAALENAPAGTEVEIPTPTEPVVDTTPVVEKPKRKRRVVKAPEVGTPETRAYAEQEIQLQRGLREQQVNQRASIREWLRSANINPAEALPEIAAAFDRGVRPIDAREMLTRRGASAEVARDVTDTAFDLHVRGHSLIEVAPTPAAGNVSYHSVPSVAGLRSPAIGAGSAAPERAAIQMRSSGGKPDAVFIDTTGLNTRTSLADIQAQTERGRMSAELSTAMQANLARQAQLSGRPLAEAHQFTGEELTREATRIAAETGIDLYVKKGKNYELVPKDVVRTDARLNRGDDLAPTPISAEAAGVYVESKTSDIGPAQIKEIMEAIERGTDITDKLPSELVPHYQAMRDAERAGIDTSERRSFIDILNDMNTMLGEQGAIGGNFTREMRMAAQRLQADMRKAGKNTREFLFGARPEDVAMFENYLASINNPVPSNSTNPRNMRFDPENIIKGDRVVKHRVVRQASGSTPSLEAPPLWRSEVTALQGARDIKPGGTEWDLKSPIRQHKAAGTEFLYYAYRTAQKNLNAELNGLHADMQELARGFSSKSLENIGANGYQRQGGDGQRILTFNKVTPKPLNAAEQRLQTTLDTIYADLFDRIQITREATGREPLARVDNYQTFARTISLLNHLGIKVDLARDTSASIHAQYVKHRASNFPYVVRKHAFYTAEMNALKILDTYAQSALKDINMSPFIAKLHELIETNLPDPVTGEETWSLKDNKPGLYEELSNWKEFLSTGTNAKLHPTARRVMSAVNNNLAYALLSGSLRSAGIQLSALVGTTYALGAVPTLKSAGEILAGHIAHPFSGGTARDFAIRNSEVLSSRNFIEAYNQAAAAIIGRRPGDIAHAIRVGDFGSVQQAVGRPGFKLFEIFDMEAAVVSWNAAYQIAKGSKMGYSHKDAVRYADDLVVRTQGSTMPGDLTGVQRNERGKLLTQFQTFLINDFNFLREEVLTKGKTGGGGGGNIPPGGVPSGTGSWETGGKRSKTQLAINLLRLLVYTQIVNEMYKILHLQPGLPDPVGDVRKGIQQGHGPAMLAWDIAVGQAERLPIVGGGLRYGKGVTGPAAQIVQDLFRAGRVDPLVSNPYKKQMEDLGLPKDVGGLIEPAGSLLGVPYLRQVGKYAKAQVRGENVWDSLMGWYSKPAGRDGRERSERRERSSR